MKLLKKVELIQDEKVQEDDIEKLEEKENKEDK